MYSYTDSLAQGEENSTNGSLKDWKSNVIPDLQKEQVLLLITILMIFVLTLLLLCLRLVQAQLPYIYKSTGLVRERELTKSKSVNYISAKLNW